MLIGVVHGPNLNLLGDREVSIYGNRTLEEIDGLLRTRAAELNADLVAVQSNHEGQLIDWIQRHAADVDGWLVNAAGLTHTSVGLRDALVAAGGPMVEVHLSNIFARESFRHRSLLADQAVGVIVGFRERSYLLGLEALIAHLRPGP